MSLFLKPEIWNGQNRPDITPQEADVVVLGLPFDGAASFRKGAAEAPERIRSISTHIAPTTEEGHLIENLLVHDLGDISQNGRSPRCNSSRCTSRSMQ